jgi:hypothetical protein
MAALQVATPAGLVLANGDGRFNTSTRPAICAAESRPPASYSRMRRTSASVDLVAVGRTAGSVVAGEECGGGEEAMAAVDGIGR